MPPLFERAIISNSAYMVRSLWEDKSNVDLRNKHSHTGLMIASDVGAIDVVQLLLNFSVDIRFCKVMIVIKLYSYIF